MRIPSNQAPPARTPTFPFRHVEYGFLSLFFVAAILVVVAMRYAMATLNGIYLLLICCGVGVLACLPIWIWLRRKYASAMPFIIQGPRRIRMLACESGFAIAAILSAATLAANRHLPQGVEREVDVSVLRVGTPGYRTGWSVEFELEGDTYDQAVSGQIGCVARTASIIRLTLQKGLLGYEFIDSAKQVSPLVFRCT